ncbi:hypothetical protein MtrunA17_Chr1g0199361 [Medicago truncatula]|uniref:Uncharacterized protein n=1 Tax=Medicago truncatula TaxID=3880 RepID=A0A396JV87_MEDTR|nr:hypothetical protein MtrunA17_Chr1g0199361 [Medicago truncatula]
MKFPVRMSGFLLVWCGRDSVMGFFVCILAPSSSLVIDGRRGRETGEEK